MAASASIIGRSARVRGRVTGSVDLEVLGFVDGEIAVDGDVTVDGGGMVGASVHGRRLVVRGAIKGDLVAGESILLEDGARVVGDVRAPRVAIAPGALVRGYVDTGAGETSAPRAGRAVAPAARPMPAVTKPSKIVAPPPPPPVQKQVPAPPPKPVAAPPAAAGAIHKATHEAGPRRPPPPVVPILKKAKGQIAKKKER